ncbi:membrane protein insertion efficiency factor YidD [Pseudoduganella sp. OTU4001]|uniref:membrane protein insertion efficiency factor YidD n=1 Tax=Pseudoduganella sp. OTU4001 TaxID=3043854 RepID=UPI00313B3EF6
MRGILLAAIKAYQRHLSPRKGYHCAHRVLHGGDGCSGYGYRVIERFGVRLGVALLFRRFDDCSAAMRAMQRPTNYQAGECDIGVPLDCDCGHSIKVCGGASEALDCVSAVGDCWPGRRKGEMDVDPKLKARYGSARARRR